MTWSAVIGMVEPNGDYQYLLSGFERLLKAYCDNGTLPDPLADFTGEFREITMPTVIKGISRLGKLSTTFAAANAGFLFRILPDLVRGSIQGRKNCDDCLLKTVSRDNSFYTKNEVYVYGRETECPNYKTVIAAVPEALNILVAGVVEKGTFELFVLLSKFIGKLSWTLVPLVKREEIVKKISVPLSNLLKTQDSKSLRELDEKGLTEVLQFVATAMTSTFDDIAFVRKLLDFGNACLRCGFLSKEIIGANLIRDLGIKSDVLKEWAAETGLFEYLIEGNPSEKVIQALGHAISIAMSGNQQSLESLMKLYNKAEHAHSSQKTVMNSFLSQALMAVDKPVAIEFLEAITKTENVTTDLINFLTTLVTHACFSHEEAVAIIVRFCLGLVDSDRDPEIVDYAIEKLVKSTLPRSAETIIFEYILKKLPTLPASGNRARSYKQLVIGSVRMGDTSMASLLQVLVEEMTKNRDSVVLYMSFVTAILKRSQAKIPTEGITFLTYSPGTWKMFGKLLRKRGLDLFETDDLNIIFTTFESLDYAKVTLEQYDCTELTVLAYAVRDGSLVPYIAGSYSYSLKDLRVKTPSLKGLCYVQETILKAEDEKVSDRALTFLMELFRSAPMTYYNHMASALVTNLAEMDLGQPVLCYRYLKFLNAMITQSELAYDMRQFGIQRHKSKHMHHITVYVKFAEETVAFECSPHTLGGELCKMVGLKFRKKSDGIYLKFGSEWLTSTEPISAKGVRDGSEMSVWDPASLKDDPAFPDQCMTSILAKDQVLEKVYEIIRQQDLLPELRRAAWKFMMLMPTTRSVSQLIGKPDELMKAIQESKSELELRYLLQFVITNNISSCAIAVFDLLADGKVSKFSFYDALQILKANSGVVASERSSSFCAFCVATLGNKELSSFSTTVIDLLLEIATEHPGEVASAFLGDLVNFRRIISNSEPEILAQLNQLFAGIAPQDSALFDALISFFDDVKESKTRICPYFKLVSDVFNKSCDGEKSLNFGISLMERSDSKLFDSVCTFFNTILSHNPGLCASHRDLFDRILKEIFQCSVTATQEAMIDILSAFASQDEACRLEMKQAFLKHFGLTTDRWGYDPASNSKSSTGLLGLRNLGATCYMNSVFQQLFYNTEFRKSVLESKPEKDWQIAFRAMFVRLLKSALPSVNTQPFASVWEVEGQIVNPRIQQDAVEFFLLLLDRLGDELYKGEMSNIMVSAANPDEFRQITPETFWTLPLVVLGQASFADSLNCFLEKETVTGYNAESLGKKIDVLRYSRVHKAPKHLVLQLKRFEYDMATWTRYKVNDKFEFPMKFDLAKLMEDETEPHEYSLTGVVIHNGTAQGGHYTSYIRKGPNKWYLFNDASVTEANDSQVHDESVGGKKSYSDYDEHLPSAYLLFYTKSELLTSDVDDEKEIDAYLEEHDQALLEEIRSENEAYLEMQALFGTAFLGYVMKSDDVDVVMPYLFNIFAHSRHTAQAVKFSDHVIDVIKKHDCVNQVMEMILEKAQQIRDILVHCTTQEIVTAFVSILKFVIDSADYAKSSKYVKSLADDLPSVIEAWRVVVIYIDLIMHFCSEHVDFVKEHCLGTTLVSTIETSLETKSIVYLQNVNFSPVFTFFKDHRELLSHDEIKRLLSLVATIVRSTSQTDAYLDFISACTGDENVDNNAFLDALLNAIKDPKAPYAVSLICRLVTNDQGRAKLFACPRLSRSDIVQSISDGLVSGGSQQVELRKKLATQGKITFYLLTCGCPTAIRRMETVCLVVFPAVRPLNSWMRAESIKSGDEYRRWSESSLPSPLAPEDIDNLHHLLLSYLEGIKGINANPEPFFSGSASGSALVHMIRVLYWMLLRVGCVLTEEQASILFDLADTLHKANIECNYNLIELLRLFVLLKPATTQNLLASRFDDLLRDFFTGNWGSSETCVCFMFAIFFDSLSAFLNHELWTRLLESPIFTNTFSLVVRKTMTSAIIPMLDAAAKSKFDISELVSKNLESLFENHLKCINKVFESCPVLMSEAAFQQILQVTLATLSKKKGGIGFTSVVKILQSLSASYSITDEESVIKLIEPAITGCIESAHSSDIATDICVLLSQRSRNIGMAILDAVKNRPHPSLLADAILLKVTEVLNGSVSHDELVALVERYEQGVDSGDGVFFTALEHMIEKTGVNDDNIDWITMMCSKIFKCPTMIRNPRIFFDFVIGKLPKDNVLSVIRDLREAQPVNDINYDVVLPPLNHILRLMPELRDEVLVMFDMVGPVYLDLEAKYGAQNIYVFPRTRRGYEEVRSQEIREWEP